MKKIRIFPLLSALLILWLLATDFVDPPPNADFFVRDNAGVLSRSATMEMAVNAGALAEHTGIQFVVVTLSETDNISPGQYATELLEREGIGGTEGRGLVLAISAPYKWGYLTAGAPMRRILVDSTGETLTGQHKLASLNRDSLLLHRAALSSLLRQQPIHSLPRYGILEKTLALTRWETAFVLALIAAMVIFTGWLKQRFYPPHYPLEKAGPFQPANAPDLLTRKPH